MERYSDKDAVQSVQPPGAMEGGRHSLQWDNLSAGDRDGGEEEAGTGHATTAEGYLLLGPQI